MTATDCEHEWVRLPAGYEQCPLCGCRRALTTSGVCPITACRRALDDHIGVKGLDHPVCPGDLPLPPPCGPGNRRKR